MSGLCPIFQTMYTLGERFPFCKHSGVVAAACVFGTAFFLLLFFFIPQISVLTI